MTSLGIVGYREFTDYDKFSMEVDKVINDIGSISQIVSGGCKGTDKMVGF